MALSPTAVQLDYNLFCLENFNTAQVPVQFSHRPDPERATRMLCEHEMAYVPTSQYYVAAAATATKPPPHIVKPHMREILGLWMCQVCVSREMDVFPTAISITDRFLAQFCLTSDDQIQLVGAASLHLASKLRETQPMLSEDVLYYTDDAYVASDLQAMETIILATLLFDLESVTPAHFLDAFMSLLEVSALEQDALKEDVLRRINISLIGTDLLAFKPSSVAAACLVASLGAGGLSVDAYLLQKLCQTIDCEQSSLECCMKLSIMAWNKHSLEVYLTSPEDGKRNTLDDHSDIDEDEEQDEQEEEDYEEDEGEGSDMDMDEGLVVDCVAERGRRRSTSDMNDFWMDSDSGIQEDFLSSQSGSMPIPLEYYDNSDDELTD